MCAFSGDKKYSIVVVTRQNRAFLVVTKQNRAVLVAVSCTCRGDKGAWCTFSGGSVHF